MLHLSRGGRRLLAFSTATLVAIGLLAGLSAGSSAHPAKAHRNHRALHGRHHGGGGGPVPSIPWGSVNGAPVNLYSLSNGRMTVNITNYGGVVQSIWVPDRWGT